MLFEQVQTGVVYGYATNWIKPSTGVRQGCPLSPYLFILTAELMSIKIRLSSDVKGISMLGKEIKVCQFADDTNFLCTDITSVGKRLKIVADFGEISGLKFSKYRENQFESYVAREVGRQQKQAVKFKMG